MINRSELVSGAIFIYRHSQGTQTCLIIRPPRKHMFEDIRGRYIELDEVRVQYNGMNKIGREEISCYVNSSTQWACEHLERLD